MEALADTYRRSLKLAASDFLSLDQHVQQLSGQSATGQTQFYRNSTLIFDPYWQQKRDSRKSSLLQKNLTSLAEDDMEPSTGIARSGVQPGTYISAINKSDWAGPSKEEAQRVSASRPDPDLDIQHSIGALLPYSHYEGNNFQIDPESTESSRQQQSRQGSTVRFALSEEVFPGHAADDASISQVMPQLLNNKSCPRHLRSIPA